MLMKTTKLITPAALVLALVATLALWSSAYAQQNPPSPAPPPSAAPKYSAADLEKLAAPIAMHPDPLIAILLPASVYPLEIVQAARFVKDTNNIPKVDEQPWDENVKALAKFPDLMQKMNDDLTWTMDLGQAFLDQQKELMDTIQSLRGKAQALGTLKTTPQQIVVVTNTVIEKTVEQQVVYVTNTIVQIQPSNPQVVYVPTYPPSMYYYYPPPVYVGPPPAVTFAVGVTVGLIIANNCDWHHGGIYVGHHGVAVWGGGGHHGDVDIDINRNVNINKNTINNVNRPAATAQKWQPDQSRMSTSGASGTRSTTQSAQSRGWSSGATPAARPSTTAARPTTTSSFSRPGSAPSQSYNRPSPRSSYSRPSASTSRTSAFGGVRSGASTRQFSSRGSISRGGGGGGRSFGGRRR
jgi:hypothetical protein